MLHTGVNQRLLQLFGKNNVCAIYHSAEITISEGARAFGAIETGGRSLADRVLESGESASIELVGVVVEDALNKLGELLVCPPLRDAHLGRTSSAEGLDAATLRQSTKSRVL